MITQKLIKEGYLSLVKTGKKRGDAAKRLHKYQYEESERNNRRLKQEYFNPYAKIGHHVSLEL
jgi:hypothetical protein